MEILNLKLTNFRNFRNLNLEFSSKINLIIGNNGSGKTNLIEAINLLALTKTFRNVFDNVLIKNNCKSATIKGDVKSQIINNFQLEITKEGKKVKINGNNINKFSDYISKILIVTFSSNDLKLIKDSPNTRRKLLNIEISQLNNNYLRHLNEYNKIIKQRNAFLKILYTNKTVSLDYLNILTEKLIDYGLNIYKERKKFIDLINELISSIYENIANNKTLKVIYKSEFFNTKEYLLEKYKKNLEKDIILGKTLVGIHTDDIEFKIDDLNLKDYGSEGQQKNAILAFKFSEIKIIEKLKNEKPILLIDDLYSELDKSKIKNILNLIDCQNQTFITVTDLNKVNKKIKELAKIIIIKNGEVREK